MKLFYYKGSCSLVVRIILNELGLTFEEEAVDLRAKKTESGENYLTINPKGAVPAIMLDNGEVLTENQVILQYLADTSTNGQKLLAPVGDFKRYRTLEWLNYISTELHKTMGLFFNPSTTDDMKTKILIPMVQMRFNMINERLAEGSFLMGDQFTLPDAYLFVMVSWTHYFKLDLSGYKHLLSYIDRLHTRPSITKSLQQEGML